MIIFDNFSINSSTVGFPSGKYSLSLLCTLGSLLANAWSIAYFISLFTFFVLSLCSLATLSIILIVKHYFNIILIMFSYCIYSYTTTPLSKNVKLDTLFNIIFLIKSIELLCMNGYSYEQPFFNMLEYHIRRLHYYQLNIVLHDTYLLSFLQQYRQLRFHIFQQYQRDQ